MMTRKGCCLCDDAYIAADLAQRNKLCQFEAVDVDSDDSLRQKYGNDVPVLLINGEEFARHFVEYPELAQALHHANKENR